MHQCEYFMTKCNDLSHKNKKVIFSEVKLHQMPSLQYRADVSGSDNTIAVERSRCRRHDMPVHGHAVGFFFFLLAFQTQTRRSKTWTNKTTQDGVRCQKSNITWRWWLESDSEKSYAKTLFSAGTGPQVTTNFKNIELPPQLNLRNLFLQFFALWTLFAPDWHGTP